MIDIAVLDDLLDRMLTAGLSELAVQQGEVRIVMRLSAEIPAGSASKPVPVRTESIGTFRAAHPRRPAGAIKPGDDVPKGIALGYLEAGATLTAIVSPVSGTLSEVIAADGDLLGFGSHVFTVEESA